VHARALARSSSLAVAVVEDTRTYGFQERGLGVLVAREIDLIGRLAALDPRARVGVGRSKGDGPRAGLHWIASKRVTLAHRASNRTAELALA